MKTIILSISTYNIYLLLTGLVILLASVIPNILKKSLLSAPIIYLAIGFGLYFLGNEYYTSIGPLDNVSTILRISEFVVLVALTNAGLKIKKPFRWVTWKYSFFLLLITMPLTIVASSYISWTILGLAPAAALLFGALISPTDPVLASDLQTSQPSDEDTSKTRLALTSEAGFNDGLAFPFTFFAIHFASKGADISSWILDWVIVDVIYKILSGILLGFLCGWLLYKIVFKMPSRDLHSDISRGILSLALTLLPYSITEVCGGYGFIAVFVAACVFSNREKSIEHMDNLHSFTEEIERIFVALLFVLIGVYLASNLEALTKWPLILTALIIILVIRPLAGFIALFRSDLTGFEKFAISFYGIRGVGSIFYLMFAFSEADFEDASTLMQLTAVTIILSVFIHGISAAILQKKLDKIDNV
ncbi:MAG TPA: cation:proton antiporter [Flavobacterium sp.]|jgi:NhaP-type Na+/H+ or K+/H+ antiporter